MGILLLGAVTPYEGLVASRSRMLQTNDATNKFMMARSAHVASENLVLVRVAFSNFYNAGSGNTSPIADTGLGATTALKASIEYPPGTFTQLLFSASASGTIADVGILFSDSASVGIPAGATFWVRSFWNNANGTLYNGWQNTFLGESTALSVTSISDQTMGGTITNSGSFSYPPLAILGLTRNASVIIVGDSIGSGFGETEDTSNSATGFDAKRGVVARSLGSIPFLNLSVSGEQANLFLTHGSARKQLVPMGSHLVSEIGINDVINAGNTSAQVIASVQAIWALRWAGQKVYQTTLPPRSSSTDAWATTGNQTTGANNSVRVTFNTSVRAILSGSVGTYDVASALESSLNSGIWTVTPTPPYTTDGLHPNNAGSLLVASAGVINPVVWP